MKGNTSYLRTVRTSLFVTLFVPRPTWIGSLAGFYSSCFLSPFFACTCAFHEAIQRLSSVYTQLPNPTIEAISGSKLNSKSMYQDFVG